MMSHLIGYAKTSDNRESGNPRSEIRFVTGTAMTVRMIMILLYGAGGEPGRGEIPMTRFRKP